MVTIRNGYINGYQVVAADGRDEIELRCIDICDVAAGRRRPSVSINIYSVKMMSSYIVIRSFARGYNPGYVAAGRQST
jgi:hypothetical protein